MKLEANNETDSPCPLSSAQTVLEDHAVGSSPQVVAKVCWLPAFGNKAILIYLTVTCHWVQDLIFKQHHALHARASSTRIRKMLARTRLALILFICVLERNNIYSALYVLDCFGLFRRDSKVLRYHAWIRLSQESETGCSTSRILMGVWIGSRLFGNQMSKENPWRLEPWRTLLDDQMTSVEFP